MVTMVVDNSSLHTDSA